VVLRRFNRKKKERNHINKSKELRSVG
jgi:hypothetical protein